MQQNIINQFIRIDNIIMAYFAAIFASFFILDKGDQRTLLYAGGPFVLYYIIKNKDILVPKFFSTLILVPLGLFFLINAVSIIWSTPENSDMYVQTGKMIIIFPIILIPFTILCKKKPSAWGLLLSSFVTAGLITSAAVIPCHWEMIASGSRLESWGIASHSILGGILYALCFLIMVFCKDRLLLYKNVPAKFFYPLALLPLAVTILTQSRGPFVAMIGAFLISSAIGKSYSKDTLIKRILPYALLLAGAISAFLYYGRSFLIERGTTGRTQIWSHAFDLIEEKIIFGHGIATNLVFPFTLQEKLIEAPHVHNIYLGTLLATGAVGLIAFISILGFALYKAFIEMKHNNDKSLIILLAFGMIAGLADLGGYFTNLSISWLLFWFPLAFLATRKDKSNDQEAAS